MANRFDSPFPEFHSSTSPYSGGVLRFFITGTSTPLAVYSDSTLVTSIGTTVTLNSAGRPSTAVFLANVAYKVTLEDSTGSQIWAADPVYASDFSAVAQFAVYAGNPNGNVAGTAGSGTTPSSVIWDATNDILYVCTTTGVAAAAVWTAVNASASTPAVPQPQGRLTLTSATPVLSADAVGQATLYYTPYVGELVALYNGTSMVPSTFSEISLGLVASHAASSIYDVFVFSNSGVLTLATGPAWTTSTPGSGARGSGAGTTQLARVHGLWTNAVSMTARNGSTTYTVAANRGTYVGTIYMDATAGQCTCHVNYGQNRKFGVWNAYNRVPIYLKAGDSTATWSYNATKVIQASNNVPATYTAVIANVGGTTSNALTVLCGLAEEVVDALMEQTMLVQSGTSASSNTQANNGIGINSITVASGLKGQVGAANGVGGGQNSIYGNTVGRYLLSSTLGLTQIFALEAVPSVGATSQNVTFNGAEAGMVLSAIWRG